MPVVNETSTLSLRIDAQPAKQGAKEFTAAIAAIKAAVKGLEREADGTFAKLAGKQITIRADGAKQAAADVATVGTTAKRTEAQAQRLGLSIASAMRASSKEAAALGAKLNALDDTVGLSRLNRDLAQLQANLAKASSPLDVRAARSGFSDTTAGLSGRAANLKAESAAEIAATREAQRHADSLDQLKRAYLPLYAESVKYEAALQRIQAAERAGAVTAAQAAAMRQQAAASMQALTPAVNAGATGLAKYGQVATNAGFQIQDFAVQVASGQSAMIAMTQQLPQLLGAFGMVGKIALYGSVAGTAVAVTAAIVPHLIKGAVGAKQLTDQIDKLTQSVTDYESSLDKATTRNADLVKEFGAGAQQAKTLYVELSNLARLDALSKMETGAKTVHQALAGVGFTLDTIAAAQAAGGEYDLAGALGVTDLKALGLTVDAAERVRDAVDALGKASGPRQFADALANVSGVLHSIKDDAGNIPVGLRASARAAAEASLEANRLAGPLAESQRHAQRLAETDMAAGVVKAGNAALFLAQQLGVSLEHAQALANEGGKKPARLGFGLPGAQDPLAGSTAQLAWPSRDVITSRGYGNAVTPYQAPYKPPKEEKAPATVEENLAKKFERDLAKARIETQGLTLETGLLTSGLLETERAAKLFASAWSQGLLTDGVRAQILEVDRLTAAHERLGRESVDGVKTFLDSVPTYTEGLRQIETAIVEGLHGSLSSVFQTGRLDLSSLVNSVRAQLADVLAKQTLKIGMDALGISGSLVDSAAITAAGATAAAAMGSSIVAAGATAAGTMATAIQAASAGQSFMAAIPLPGFAQGGYSDGPAMTYHSAPAAAFANAPHFAQGTANTSGIPAILHPNEAVVPLSKGRKIPIDMGDAMAGSAGAGGGSITINTTNNVTVEGSSDEGGEELGAKLGAQLSGMMTLRIREVLSEELHYGGMLRPRGS